MKAVIMKLRVNLRKLRAHLAIGMLAAAIVLTGAASARAGTSLIGVATTDTGLPIVTHSTIEMVDFNGTMRTVLTTLPGIYKADTTGLIPPILVKSDDEFGISLTGSGIANVTTVTNEMLNDIYQTLNTNAPAQFVSPTRFKLTPIQFQSEWSLFKDVFQQPYTFYKISPTFNPFTTKFSYSGGYAKFFGNTTFGGLGTATQTVHSTLGTLDWSATFHADPTIHWVTSMWKSQLPSMGPYSVSGGYTVIPTDPNAGATYGGVSNFYKTLFSPILNHEKKFLDSGNLAPLYDLDFLDGGRNALIQSEFDATKWRPLIFKTITPGLIQDYKPNFDFLGHNRIRLAVDYTESLNGGTFTKRRYETFKCNADGTGCLFYGDQQFGGTSSEIKFEASSLSAGVPTTLQQLRAKLISPQGQFLSVHVSDAFGSYFNDALMNKSLKTEMLQPQHNGPIVPYLQDEWSSKTTLSVPFVYGNQFTYFADSFTYDSYVFGFTFEPVHWITPDVNGTHQLSDFKLGVPTLVKFTPQLTYPVVRVGLEGTACSTTQSVDLTSVQKFIKPTATSASIIVPKLVMGQATAGFDLRVRYEGPYGQNSSFDYAVGQSCTPW